MHQSLARQENKGIISIRSTDKANYCEILISNYDWNEFSDVIKPTKIFDDVLNTLKHFIRRFPHSLIVEKPVVLAYSKPHDCFKHSEVMPVLYV